MCSIPVALVLSAWGTGMCPHILIPISPYPKPFVAYNPDL